MDTESCKVLVQTDDAGRVTAINSDAFVSGDGWTAIDEGEGDRYRHAQNNYLLKPLTDERGVYRYKLVDGLVAQRVNNVEQRTDALESANDDLILMMADLIGG